MNATLRNAPIGAMHRRLRVMAVVLMAIATLATWRTTHVDAYVSSGYNWGVKQVPYYVNPSNLYVPPADAIAAIQSSAAAWTTQSNAGVQLVYSGTTNGSSAGLNYKNEVFFRTDAPGAIAQTYMWANNGHLVDTDVVFYENYAFFTHAAEPCSGGYYIENTITHEFGHALGLYHSATDTATMYATEGACETLKETLDADDIAGIQSLYPPTSNMPPAAPSQLSVVLDVTNPTSSLAQTWVDNASNATGYRVERSPDGVSFSQIAQLGSTAVSYVDSGLGAGATYYYRVAAYNGSGMSAYSNLGTGQTQAFTTAPLAPTSPSPATGATGVGTSATLSWGCSGANSYDVYINGTLYAANLGSSSVSVSSLAPGTTYSWSVIARNNVGSTVGPTWSLTTKSSPGNSGKNRK